GGGCGATAATCRPATCASISDSERRRASRQLSSNGRMDRPNDGRTFGETAWSRFAAAQAWHHEDREGHGDQRTTKLTKTTKKTLAAGLWLGALRRSFVTCLWRKSCTGTRSSLERVGIDRVPRHLGG